MIHWIVNSIPLSYPMQTRSVGFRVPLCFYIIANHVLCLSRWLLVSLTLQTLRWRRFSSGTSVNFQRTTWHHIPEDIIHRYSSTLPFYDVKWNALLPCEFMTCSIGNRWWRWAGQYAWSVQRMQDPPPAISWMKDEAHLHGWVVSVGISARYVSHINNTHSRCMQYLRASNAYFRTLVHFIL
jgi:hypothetical protein